MGWKQNASDYFTFGKRDRAGVLGVLLILSVIYFLPKLAPVTSSHQVLKPDTAILSLLDTLETHEPAHKKGRYSESYENVDVYQPSRKLDYTKAALFLFDPNTLSPEGWESLGLSAKTAATIRKYVNKGGVFKNPEDLQKIWGLPKGFYERVSAYIKIESVAAKTFKPEYPPANKFERSERKIWVVEINSADTSALIALPGIGSKLAFRITNFRDKLGGFHSVDQVKETYGLADSTFQKIKSYLNINAAGVRKFNINTASKDELKLHPYIKWNLANAIVEYRNQHGAFKSLAELKNIVLVDDATFEKISPYLIL